MFAKRHVIAVVTAADGSATAYSEPGITGRIHAICYGKVDFADGVDFTITLESTGESLWADTNVNASETVYPVQKANLGGTGAPSSILEVPVIAANDRVKIVIAQGGNAKSGVFQVIVT
jgi:hypothetical protein